MSVVTEVLGVFPGDALPVMVVDDFITATRGDSEELDPFAARHVTCTKARAVSATPFAPLFAPLVPYSEDWHM
jgi:hypothetical protein